MKALPLMLFKLWLMLKFFKSRSKFKVKVTSQKLWSHVKGLVIKNTHVKYESPTSYAFKLWLMLKFFKSRSKFKVKVTRSKIMVTCERSCHKEYTCEISKPHLLWS